MARRKTSASTALTPFDAAGSRALAQFAGYEKQIAKQKASVPAGGGVPTISGNGGVFTFPGGARAETFQAVVLCALRANAYWAGEYKPGSNEPPDCAAIAQLGEHENTMVPIDGYDKQAESCAQCPHNVRPQKACRNGLRLALVPDDALTDVKAAQDASLAMLRVSSTGIAPFGEITDLVAEKGLPLFAVVMEFANLRLNEEGTYYTTVARPRQVVSEEVARILGERVEEAERFLVRAAQPVPKVGDAKDDGGPAPRRRVVAGGAKTTPAKGRRKSVRKKTRKL